MKNRTYRCSSLGKDAGIGEAAKLLQRAGQHFGLSKGEMGKLSRGDLRRAAIGWAIHRQSGTPMAWIAEKLNLSSAANASQQIRRLDGRKLRSLPKDVPAWRKRMTSYVD
ncbi:hypothetical protein N9260_01100 [bacterium]|nr:hypothetical protein [bacterium]